MLLNENVELFKDPVPEKRAPFTVEVVVIAESSTVRTHVLSFDV